MPVFVALSLDAFFCPLGIFMVLVVRKTGTVTLFTGVRRVFCPKSDTHTLFFVSQFNWRLS